ncbi:predicted protein [Chaetoceros tenuissimus]|uniref:Uncharacterized protein n=1 Tax=Chaetoceros tenuissimus TaxID=426638 RepID=A0AAD3CKA0_9STRA|nr:predicted protein [Chaetoceros tenuissimus]
MVHIQDRSHTNVVSSSDILIVPSISFQLSLITKKRDRHKKLSETKSWHSRFDCNLQAQNYKDQKDLAKMILQLKHIMLAHNDMLAFRSNEGSAPVGNSLRVVHSEHEQLATFDTKEACDASRKEVVHDKKDNFDHSSAPKVVILPETDNMKKLKKETKKDLLNCGGTGSYHGDFMSHIMHFHADVEKGKRLRKNLELVEAGAIAVWLPFRYYFKKTKDEDGRGGTSVEDVHVATAFVDWTMSGMQSTIESNQDALQSLALDKCTTSLLQHHRLVEKFWIESKNSIPSEIRGFAQEYNSSYPVLTDARKSGCPHRTISSFNQKMKPSVSKSIDTATTIQCLPMLVRAVVLIVLSLLQSEDEALCF